MPVCAPVLMHATPPPVSSADDIGAEESDDKCPLSANEADDKWAGARAAPLRCNNRRWMAWRPPPPTPCAGNGSRSGSARPGGSRASCLAANHCGRGRAAQARELRAQAAAPQRRNKAARSAGAGGALGVRLAGGQDTQLCTHMACTRTSRLCPCTVHLQLPHLTGPRTHAFVPCMSIHLSPDLCTHPLTEIRVHRAIHLYPSACKACTCLQKPLLSGHMYAVNMPAHTWIICVHISRNACAWTQALTHSPVHTIQGPHPHPKDTHNCINKY